jgi:signal transduction histidine kinase/ActR/RegA family two-component response regulator
LEPEFRLAKWALVVQWLENDEIDLVQGMAFSIERAKKMYFSDAHTQTWRSIFVRKDSPLESSKDILNATIVLQQGDIANDYLKRIRFTGKIVNVPSQEDALKLLDSGQYDACIVTHMNGIHILHRDKLNNIKALPERLLQREYCFASKDIRLIEAINGALLSLSQSGQLAIIQNKWFGNAIQEEHSDASFIRLHPWFIPLISLLFVLIISLLFVIRAYRRSRLELQSELNIRKGIQTELNREYSIFVRGPVILYKMQMQPVKPLMISENVDQWGYSADEIIELGEKFTDLVFSEDKEKFFVESSDSQQPDYSVKRYRIVTKSGEIRWVLDYSTSVESQRSERLHYGYLMDITSQSNLEAQLMESKEKAEASNTAKSHFLANMSHEIRTPLNGITGFLQVLMQMQASPEQQEYYEIMYASGRNLMKIINDILDFSKIESGKLDLIQSIFNPRILIEETVKPFVMHNKGPELEIRYQLNANIPNVLFGDQLRLKQIVINLLQNAVKFTESGLVEVAVDVYTMNEKDIRLLFRISDTGIGIDPRKQEDIFDNFSQANSLITSKYGGTGLGLSIVKRLVELMNGFIWVESEQGKGSSFFFILPFELRTEDTEPLPDSSNPAEMKLAKLTGMEVLLVEDEPINQVVTRRQLESWDISVTVAANGLKALELCKDHHYHAILMDIQMPVMDGITATRTLRLSEIKAGLHTPVIAFTAAALVGDRERFLDCGMDDYIAKPIDMAQLHSILVKYALKKSDSRR